MKTRYNKRSGYQGPLLYLGFLLFFNCISALPTHGQVAEWTFENIGSAVPSLPITASSKIPQVSASADLSGGNNNGSPDICSGAETWATNFWPTGNSRSTGDYLEFSVRADPGETIGISYFSFSSSASSANSALDFDVYYSKNNFTNATYLFSGSQSTGGCSFHGVGFNEILYSNVTIRFRIYPYGQNIAAQAATIRIDDVRIDGELLPITLTGFSAQVQNDQVLLQWSTASEVNNDYMAVERSPDGISFQEIGKVPGYGTTTEAQRYQLIDPQPMVGTNYYRLRQVDFDGTVTYHPIITVNMDQHSRLPDEIRVFPTLATSSVQVELGFQPNLPVSYTIYSLLGQPMKNGLIETSTVSMAIQELPAGPYFLTFADQHRQYTTRFVKR